MNVCMESIVEDSSTQSWAWALKKSLTRPSCFLYFREIRNKRSHWPGGRSAYEAPRLTLAIISGFSAHVSGLHMWASAGQGPSSSSPKQWSLMVVLRFTTLSAQDCHWENPRRKKLHRGQSNIKSAHCQAQCHATWQRGSRNFTIYQESNACRQTLCNSPNPLSHMFVSFTIYQKFEDGVEMRGTTRNWCCIERIVVSP